MDGRMDGCEEQGHKIEPPSLVLLNSPKIGIHARCSPPSRYSASNRPCNSHSSYASSFSPVTRCSCGAQRQSSTLDGRISTQQLATLMASPSAAADWLLTNSPRCINMQVSVVSSAGWQVDGHVQRKTGRQSGHGDRGRGMGGGGEATASRVGRRADQMGAVNQIKRAVPLDGAQNPKQKAKLNLTLRRFFFFSIISMTK